VGGGRKEGGGGVFGGRKTLKASKAITKPAV